CRQSVLLIFNRSCSYSLIGENVIEVASVFRIKHFLGSGESADFDGMQMKFPDSDQAFQKVWLFVRFRLMQHAFVSFSCCSWFVRIDPRDQNQFVFDFFVESGEPFYVFADCIFVICGAWSDDNKKFIGIPGEYILNLSISFFFDFFHVRRHRIFLFQLFRLRKSGLYLHCHNLVLFLFVYLLLSCLNLPDLCLLCTVSIKLPVCNYHTCSLISASSSASSLNCSI